MSHTTYAETKRKLALLDRINRDAYHERNGYSMTKEQRAWYRGVIERANVARHSMGLPPMEP